ncbi:MAG TPA: ribbon-helix-helix domain-containing protein [Candidatus Saccharimonadales bacterium]|nr:ribbon-helix-helix domain-containing protein [Candidatus Saccharimonadales bacterium]
MPKPSLQEAMSRAAHRTPFGRAPELPRTKKAVKEAASAREHLAPPSPSRSKSRVGKKVISGFFDKEVSRQLSKLAIDQDRTKEDLLREAINDLFAKYHLPNFA